MVYLALILSIAALIVALVALREGRQPTPPCAEAARLSDMEQRLEELEKHLEKSSPYMSAVTTSLAGRVQRLESQRPDSPAPAADAPLKAPAACPMVEEARALRDGLVHLWDAVSPKLRPRLESVARQVEEASAGLPSEPEPYALLRRSLIPDLLEMTEEEEAALTPLRSLARLLQVDFIEPQKGHDFVPELHELLKVERAEQAELTNKVSRCLSAGLSQNGTLLKKAEVSVYR